MTAATEPRCTRDGCGAPFALMADGGVNCTNGHFPPPEMIPALRAMIRARGRARQAPSTNGHYGVNGVAKLQTEPPTIDRPVGGFLVPLAEANGAALAAAAAEGDALPSLPFLGRSGYIIELWSHLLAGYPRSGKTELLVALCREWLNQDRRVLYISEEPRSIWVARLALRPGDWSGLTVVFGLGAEPDALMRRAFAPGHEETIVILDTIRNLLRVQDETDNGAIAGLLNPWVAAARGACKTLIAAHHTRKGGGDHGEGIAGGHALLGVFDMALELLFAPGQERRRLIRAYGRLVMPPELVYERAVDGSFKGLGDPRELALEEVSHRAVDVLGDEWLKTKEILDGLDEPKPSLEQLRRALAAVAASKQIERDPPMESPASGKTVRWRSVSRPVYETSYGTTEGRRLGLGAPAETPNVCPRHGELPPHRRECWVCASESEVAP